MKILLALLLSVGSAFASPFLVCDPAADPLTSYVITGLPKGTVTVPATVNPDGTYQLNFDLAGVPNGTYTFTAAAVNSVSTGPSSSVTATLAASGTATWSPYSGYSLYYGTVKGGPYPNKITVSNVTASSLVIPGLVAGTRYYFVLHAFRTDGTESQCQTRESSFVAQ